MSEPPAERRPSGEASDGDARPSSSRAPFGGSGSRPHGEGASRDVVGADAPRPPYRTAILTLSDRGYTGERPEDLSAAAIRESLPERFEVAEYAVLPDERGGIADALRRLADRPDIHLVLTTGGTGLAPRDVTPEATREALEYEAPGFGEAMRAEGLRHTPFAMLSRAVVGVRSRTLIVNLPGSPKGVRESLGAILPALPHALDTLGGDPASAHGGETSQEPG